jgi:hypothetical protein
MSNSVLRLGLIAGAVAMLLCSAVAASPSWLGGLDTNSYTWNAWGGITGQTNYVVPADATTGSGTGSATVSIATTGAGFVSGPDYAIGSRDTYLDLGPSGTIHLDVSSDPRGMELWVQAIYHVDMAAAPLITINGGSALSGTTMVVEDTGLDPQTPSGWTLYQYLWKINPADIGSFNGIDILADAQSGSFIQQVSIDTRFLPEPGSMIVVLSGIIGLAGLALRRRSA